MIKFDHYSGPTLHDGTVPITPLRRTWFNVMYSALAYNFPSNWPGLSLFTSPEDSLWTML